MRIISLFADLSSQERFYEIALQRDEALVVNTLKQMEAQQQPVAILVTGGFHTQGLTQLLKERGVAYAVISPTIDGTIDETLYSALLLNRVPSIETLITEFTKTITTRESPRGHRETLIPDPGIFPSSDQGHVQEHRDGVSRSDQGDAPGQTKRAFLRRAWTYLEVVALSVKGWTTERIQTTLVNHPTLRSALGQVGIQRNDDGDVELAIGQETLAYALEGDAVQVVAWTRTAQQEEQLASIEPGSSRVLRIGEGAVRPLAGTNQAVTQVAQPDPTTFRGTASLIGGTIKTIRRAVESF